MLKEQFLGRCPSHFQVNPIVKGYILSESFLWAAWNFVTPIFAIFVVNDISGGNVEVAAGGYSVYLISRVIFELFSGRYLLKSTDSQKIFMTILGMICMSISYAGFAFSGSILSLFYFYFVAGMGLGISTPAKNALFSTHLDKNKESTEWGIADAAVFIAMALATALGGFFAHQFGFRPLFILALVVNIIGILPYIFLLKR